MLGRSFASSCKLRRWRSDEHFKSGGPSPETLLGYVYTYDAAGNRTAKKTDYDDDDGSFAATATYTNNGYNQLTAVTGSPGRGTKINVTGTIPTAWTLTAGDVTVAPNEGDPVPAEVRGRFFVARNVPLQDGDNTLVASTTATSLAGNEPTSDTVEDVALDTSLDEDYTYNANGDLIQKTEDVNGTTVQWDYTYDVRGWLIEVEKKAGAQTMLVEEYFYDPAGRKYRVSTTQNQQTDTRYFVYDGGSILLELAHVATPTEHYEMETEYVRGLSMGGGIGGLLYTRDADGTVGYFHYDGQGNVVSVTDASRTEVAYYEYDAWGNVLTSCGNLTNEFRFSTKQASTGTGLIDFGYRHYDPKTGRWTQRDPIGISGGVNLYLYGSADPIASIDPWGLDGDENDGCRRYNPAMKSMWYWFLKKHPPLYIPRDKDEYPAGDDYIKPDQEYRDDLQEGMEWGAEASQALLEKMAQAGIEATIIVCTMGAGGAADDVFDAGSKVVRIFKPDATVRRALQAAKEGAKNFDEYLKHYDELMAGIKRLQGLRGKACRFKGTVKQARQLASQIAEEEKMIGGHIKEMAQKWPDLVTR